MSTCVWMCENWERVFQIGWAAEFKEYHLYFIARIDFFLILIYIHTHTHIYIYIYIYIYTETDIYIYIYIYILVWSLD